MLSLTDNPLLPQRVPCSVNTIQLFRAAGEKKLIDGAAVLVVESSRKEVSLPGRDSRGLLEMVNGTKY